MRDMQNQGVAVDSAIGRRVAPETCKAWVGQLLNSKPELKGSLARFASANEGAGGVPVRRRADTKYSRVGIAYDAAGVLQTQDPSALYSTQIGGMDPVIGQLTEVDTNVISAAKQTSNEMFKGHALGFTVQLLDLGTGGITQDEITDLWRTVLENVSPVLTLGTQNQQRFPPLAAFPGLAAGFQSSGAVTIAAARQGRQALIQLTPPVYLAAGESYGIELRLKRRTSNGIFIFNGGPTFADFKFMISCVMYGVSYTGIPG